MTYLVTGATGTIGQRVTRLLLACGERPVVLVRDARRARSLFGHRVEVRVADLSGSRASLVDALAGIDAAFLVTSGPQLATWDRTFARAARDVGLQRIVKLSTLDVLSGVGTGPWHARGEEALRACGIPCTFLRAGGFMSNALAWADAIATEGVMRASTGDGRIAFIHPDDLAAVAVHALTTAARVDEALVLTGPEALSYGAMAAALGAATGRSVRFEAITDHEARAAVGRGPYADALVDIWRAVREGRMATVTDTVARTLGRAPLPFARWAEEHAGAFQATR